MTRLPLVFVLLASCAGGGAAGGDAKAGPAACTPETLAFDSDDAAEIVAGLAAEFAGAGAIDAWARENGRKPRIRFRKVVNKTQESIDLQAITAQLQKAMVAGGKVELLAEPGPGIDAVHTEQDAGAPLGHEKGADVVGSFEILSADEATATERIRLYTAYVTLTGTDLTKLWLGEHQLTKMCELPAAE